MTQYQPLKLVSLNTSVPSNAAKASFSNLKLSLTSPASILVDAYSDQKPVTVHGDDGVQETLHVMQAMKVSVCVVENSQGAVVGIVTKRDLMGQRSVAFCTSTGIPRSDLSVRDVMIPRSSLYCISKEEARSADIGDVVETLKRIGDGYILITDNQALSSLIYCVVSTQELNSMLDTHLQLGYRALNMMDMHFSLSGLSSDF